MSVSSKNLMTAQCSWGGVELQAIGIPIVCSVCYCDDCQRGARQIGALLNAPPVQEPDGGTEYVLYRKDRVKCLKGAHLLQGYKLTKESATNRIVATCCNSGMYLSFDRGPHWLSLYRARLQGDVPPLEMCIQTRFKPENVDISSDIPSYPAIPVKLLGKLVASRIAMLVQR